MIRLDENRRTKKISFEENMVSGMIKKITPYLVQIEFDVNNGIDQISSAAIRIYTQKEKLKEKLKILRPNSVFMAGDTKFEFYHRGVEIKIDDYSIVEDIRFSLQRDLDEICLKNKKENID